MNATVGALESWLPARGARSSDPAWLADERHRGLAEARRQGLPTQRHEAWRYTGLKPLLEKGFKAVSEVAATITEGEIESVLVPGLDSYRILMINGCYQPALSVTDHPRAGMRIESLRHLVQHEPEIVRGLLAQAAEPDARLFTALNTAAIDDGLVVLVDPDVAVDRPIELIHLSTGIDEPRVAQPRHLVVLGDGARVSLIERYVGIRGALYCTNSVAEVILGQGAHLVHHRIQAESPVAFHLSSLFVRQRAASGYHGVNIGFGSAWARTDLVARFDGPDARCDFEGLYLAGDGQLIDYHLEVDHRIPQCTSREHFKGLLYGRGRAVFDGRVHVARDAQKTDAQMSNHNLLLSPNAEVDAKPQLEIYADDVKCSHGTTVGQIDPERLFYLRSRGIPADQARRILCLGFAGEILDRLEPAALREHVAEQVGAQLERTFAAS